MRFKSGLPLRSLFLLALFSGCLDCWSARADDYKWTSLTPDEGEVVAVVVDPARPEIVYAGTTGGGVFKTIDGGRTWKPINDGLGSLGLPEIRALVMDNRVPDRLFAATAAGVYKTNNGGRTWIRLNDSDAHDLALVPANGDLIFVDRSNTLFKSTNGGTTWAAIGKGKARERLHTLRINPSNPNVIYAGNRSEMIKSVDGGVSWASCSLPPTRVFDKWAHIPTPSDARPYDIVLDPTNPNVVYVSTVAGILKSTDSGASWASINVGLHSPHVSTLAIDPSHTRILFAETSRGLFRSLDGGAYWAASRDGLESARVNAITVVRSQWQLVYAATERGIFKSTDGGAHWALSKVGMHNLDIRRVVVSPADSNVLYAQLLYPDALRSTNRGVSWERVGVEWANNFVMGFGADPSDPMTVYAATIKGPLKSIDAGMSWTSVGTGLPENYSHAVAVDPTNPKVIYLWVSSNRYPPRELSGIYKSTDGGASWQRRSTGLTEGMSYMVAIAPSAPQTLYTSIGSAMYKSTDGGANWARLAPVSVSPYALAIDPANPNVVFAATAVGLYKTTNGGEDWRRLDISSKVRAVQFVTTDPYAGSLVYVSASSSVFVSADGGETWSEANVGLPALSVHGLAVDPRDPDLVYAGTNGAGIFKRRFAILTIASVVEAQHGLMISGRHFSLSPRVFINGFDCTDLIVNAHDQFIQLQGSARKLHLKPGDNHIQVTNTEQPLVNTQSGSSNVYVLKRQ